MTGQLAFDFAAVERLAHVGDPRGRRHEAMTAPERLLKALLDRGLPDSALRPAAALCLELDDEANDFTQHHQEDV